MTLPRAARAVILDMDGTLHDTERLYVAALHDAVAAMGGTISEAFTHGLIGLPGGEADAALRAHLGPDFPHAAMARAYDAALRAALAGELPVKPGAAALVAALARSSRPVAVATSASRRGATEHLARSGLGRHLPVVVTRDDVARGKPFPDLFLLAASRLGVPPADCVAVEDSVNGLRAARAAGTMPILVPDLVPPTDAVRALADHVAGDLHEVMRVLGLDDPARG